MDGRAENMKAQPANEPENEKDNRDGIQHTNESLLPDWLDLFIFRYLPPAWLDEAAAQAHFTGPLCINLLPND